MKKLPMFLLLAAAISCNDRQAYIDNYMQALEKDSDLEAKYLTAGNQAYCIGFQDGSFPDLGFHVFGEMGGVWAHPVKLADGFWLELGENGSSSLLEKADSYRSYPYGNSFTYRNAHGLEVERFQFVPRDRSGLIINYSLKNDSDETKRLFIGFIVKSDLLPCWLANNFGTENGKDKLSLEDGICVAEDEKNGWAAAWTWTLGGECVDYSPQGWDTKGSGCWGEIKDSVTIEAGKTVSFNCFIAGSAEGKFKALDECMAMKENQARLLEQNKEHYASVIGKARIKIPDKDIQDVYNYAKINTSWLEIKTGGYHFYGAGACEYPWLFGCDNEYSVGSIARCLNPELAMETLSCLEKVSRETNGNGRIIHEANSFIHVGNHGNTQETAQFAIAVFEVFRWTGDKEWLSSLYPYMKMGMEWIYGEMDKDRDMMPEGYGMVEINGLNVEVLDVTAYSCRGLECMSEIASILGEDTDAAKWADMAEKAKITLNSKMWDEENGSYCDFYCTGSEAVGVMQASLEQEMNSIWGKDSVKIEYFTNKIQEYSLLEPTESRAFTPFENWTISVPMECGLSPKERADSLLKKMRESHCNEYAPLLMTVGNNNSMTILSGVQATAEANYGHTDNAVEYLKMMSRTLGYSLPGSMYEINPDMGCPAQEWTIYAPVSVLIDHVFGINPNPMTKTVSISPSLPEGWNKISIEDLTVADMTFSLFLKRENGKISHKIKSDNKEWKFIFE